MILEKWKNDWGISEEAMADLYRQLSETASYPLVAPRTVTTEADLQNIVRVEYNKTGGILWRNNVGATQDSYGNFFRYGLANDTKGMSKVIKSADLIGIRPIKIKQEHVGQTMGRFVSFEIKSPDWKMKKTDREKAQAAWAALINSLGGDARIVNEVNQIW